MDFFLSPAGGLSSESPVRFLAPSNGAGQSKLDRFVMDRSFAYYPDIKT
jgi:hypothetical protein